MLNTVLANIERLGIENGPFELWEWLRYIIYLVTIHAAYIMHIEIIYKYQYYYQ